MTVPGRQTAKTTLAALLPLTVLLMASFADVARSQAALDENFGVEPNPTVAIPNGYNNIAVFRPNTASLFSCVRVVDDNNNPVLDNNGEPELLNVQMALIEETGTPPSFMFQVVSDAPFASGSRDCSGRYNVDTGWYEDTVLVNNPGHVFNGTFHMRMQAQDTQSWIFTLQDSGLTQLPHISEVQVEFNGGRVQTGGIVETIPPGVTPNLADLPWPECSAEMIWGDQRLPLQAQLVLELLDGTPISFDDTLESAITNIRTRCVTTLAGSEQSISTTTATVFVLDLLPEIVGPDPDPTSSITNINPTSGTASGGTGVILTGTGFTDATSVTFGGVAATSVNVVNSTTITAVTPAHAVGAVDVVVTIPSGTATQTSGYTYVATAVGQSTGGGVIAALDGGLSNLIAASADNSVGARYGGVGIITGASSNVDGAANTTSIVTTLGAGAYAAQICQDYEVDSQGNTPCEAGNACYNDWFVPAADQLDALYNNRVAIGGFANDVYWTSTENSGLPSTHAMAQDFGVGASFVENKDVLYRLRCVRAFSP